jgi:fumarate hydratase class I
MSNFAYYDPYPLQKEKDNTEYRFLGKDGVTTEKLGSHEFLKVTPEAIQNLTKIAFHDIMHFLRPSHLEKVAKIIADPEASENDKYVATTLLENAMIAAEGVFPGCQDTGTAIVMGKKGDHVLTEEDDQITISRGIYNSYQDYNFRYSQVSPVDMYTEKNTGNNLPAQIDVYSTKGNEYNFLFVAKGGGSANKSMLFQQTKALLNPQTMMRFLEEKIKYLGTAACPPYHLAVVIGGTSAEQTLKMVKLASCGYMDNLPSQGGAHGQAFRDLELEDIVFKMTQKMGIGAQFGGKYFCHDVRVIRLPRHGASCPVGIGVSCSADRQIKGKITKDGIYLEQLEMNPARLLPVDSKANNTTQVIKVDLNQGMDQVRKKLSQYPIKTRVMLSGKMIVARDSAHAKLKELIDAGKPLPDYVKNCVVYYAGPAKTPKGHASGSFGPTTAQRMDPYVGLFQANGGSFVTLAKGNRTQEVTDACKKYGGFYLGSIGGPAAQLGRDCITSVKVIDYPELGMEAIYEIEVKDFPAFIVVDDKGNDFFANFREVE